eukprot:SAG22_NODE_861_length_6818_cov_3.155850_7_plen_61_part_00
MNAIATHTARLIHWLTRVAPKGSPLHSLSLVVMFLCLVVALVVVKKAIDKQKNVRTLKFN